MQEFECQHLVDLAGVISVSLEVSSYDSLELVTIEVRPGKRSRVQEYFLYVIGEYIAVPDPEVTELVSAKEEAFEAKMMKPVVKACQPLGHSVIVGIFSLARELGHSLGDR